MNGSEKQTVLVIDGTAAGTSALESVLAPEWTVKTAQDVGAALRIAAADPKPALILLDMHLPEPSGFDVCRRLKEKPETREIPILLITDERNPAEESRGLELGAVDILFRPFHKPLVQARMRLHQSLQAALSGLTLRNKELEELVSQDELTGLYNRRRLDDLLAAEVARARRYTRPLSLLLLDIDRFKRVNDTHGHVIGDRVLAETAEQLRRSTRVCDLIGRWGGDEFLILCPETPADTALLVGERLRENFARHVFSAAGQLTASFGASSLRDGQQAGDLFADADQALYRAKQNGRNRVERAPR